MEQKTEEKYRLIALCTSRVYDSGVHAFIENLAGLLKARGFRLLVYALNADQYWAENLLSAECAVFDFIPFERIEAVILMDEKIKSRRVAEHIISRAHAAGKAVIVLDGTYEGCSCIRFDFRSGFERVVRHVIEDHGVRHPHLMAGIPENPFSDERIEVFKEVLSDNGIPYDDSMISFGMFWAIPARKCTEELLKRDELPEAIICANDIMAINVSDTLQNAGVDVPGRVLVTGFDGYDEVFMVAPSITTADCSPIVMAKSCDGILERCISGELLEPSVEPELILNESCGCPRCTAKLRSSLNSFNRSFYRFQDETRLTHDSITGIITSNSVEETSASIAEALKAMSGRFTASLSCIADRKCFSKEQFFFTECMSENEEYAVFFDSALKADTGTVFDTKKILPLAEERLKDGYPLVIHALDYMNRCMGYIVYSFKGTEITEYSLTANITEMINMGLGGYITTQYQQYLMGKVADMYRLDALTGLLNRAAFHAALQELIARLPEEGRPMMILMTDLDGLKIINDTLGHDAGDRAIAASAAALKASCPKESLCVRFGGDEMMALIPVACDKEAILENIQKMTAESSAREGFRISASCGTYESRLYPHTDIKNVIKKADEEMYAVKKSRKREA
ncbi:MAG: GGDEF domain-containing protein [Lachnospiraceae bacterium]|nr:GGDEF domain-containing protein [Lachnospiraceae bacterium]